MRAIGYIRVSTQEQADSGLGMEAQEQRIRAYCQMRSLDLEIVTDAGVSGGKPLAQRPGGAAIMAKLKRGAKHVIILKLDRAFRNATDCLQTVDIWDRNGTALHIVDLGGNAIDTTSAAGRFMLVVLAGAAEMERNLTRERTRSALAVKKANGERVGTVPYGYDLDRDGVTLRENAAEQQAIATMRTLRVTGYSYEAIAAELDRTGIPTKRNHGSRWTHQAVRRILQRAD